MTQLSDTWINWPVYVSIDHILLKFSCKFYNLSLLHITFSHPTTYISFQSYIHTYIMSSLLAFSSIYRKMKTFSSTELASFYLLMTTRSRVANQILPLFLFHDPLHINPCLTLIQYIQLVYAILGCR